MWGIIGSETSSAPLPAPGAALSASKVEASGNGWHRMGGGGLSFGTHPMASDWWVYSCVRQDPEVIRMGFVVPFPIFLGMNLCWGKISVGPRAGPIVERLRFLILNCLGIAGELHACTCFM